MTRFEMEISGNLGYFWKKHAEDEVKKAVEQADREAMVEPDGAIRWIRSGNYIPDDYCEKLEFAGYNFDRQATQEARDAQTTKVLENYRRNHRGFTQEEIMEARAAFGAGTVLVNVITGEEVTV